jgi:hypothetical protein
MRYLDPTISNWSKAAAAGIDAQHSYETQVRFDMENGELAERLGVYASLKLCVATGDMTPDELPEWADRAMRYEQMQVERGRQYREYEKSLLGLIRAERAPAPAPVETRYSTHQERRMTRKRAQVAEQQARERERSVKGLHQLVEAWGARVKGEIAPLRRVR